MVALKNTNARRVLLSLCALPQAGQEEVRAAVLACADAAYVYSTTKSKPAEQKLRQVVVAVSSLADSRAGFDKGVGLAKGLALTREWANRPANHATPTLLAQAAKELGKLRKIRVEVLGPRGGGPPARGARGGGGRAAAGGRRRRSRFTCDGRTRGALSPCLGVARMLCRHRAR